MTIRDQIDLIENQIVELSVERAYDTLRQTVAAGIADATWDDFIDLIAISFKLDAPEIISHLTTLYYSFSFQLKVDFSYESKYSFVLNVTRHSQSDLVFSFNAAIRQESNIRAQVLWFMWVLPLFIKLMTHEEVILGSSPLTQGDAGVEPGLAYCANGQDFILIPDNIFLSTRGYEHMRSFTSSNKMRWGDKKPIAFWRGATTGRVVVDGNGSYLQRLRLAQLSKTIPSKLDAGVTSIIQLTDLEVIKSIEQSGVMKHFVTPEEQSTYRFLIDIDGNTNAWGGLFQKLLSRSTILKVESAYSYKQWYYPEMLPWTHYVPVNADLSDLHDKIDWAMRKASLSEEIANSAFRFAERMTFDREIMRGVTAINLAFRIFG